MPWSRRGKKARALPSSEPALALANKLLAFAREQESALDRSATTQFDWLVLRRAEVTSKLEAVVASGVQLEAEESSVVAALKEDLAAVDRRMEKRVQGMLRQAQDVQTALRRSRRGLSGYLHEAPRVPSFVDKRR